MTPKEKVENLNILINLRTINILKTLALGSRSTLAVFNTYSVSEYTKAIKSTKLKGSYIKLKLLLKNSIIVSSKAL